MPDVIQRYPLAWPAGWKRTDEHRRVPGRFLKKVWRGTPGGVDNYRASAVLSIADGVGRVMSQLHTMGIDSRDIIVSSNLRVRQDGLPYSDQRQPADPGVAVYWVDRAAPGSPRRCMAVDAYMRVEHNLAALAATIEALRAIERHGGAVVLDRAYTGFTALPAPGATTAPSWFEVLGFAAGVVVSRDALVDRHRRLRSIHHPDKGGDAEMFSRVQTAYEQGCAALGVAP